MEGTSGTSVSGLNRMKSVLCLIATVTAFSRPDESLLFLIPFTYSFSYAEKRFEWWSSLIIIIHNSQCPVVSCLVRSFWLLCSASLSLMWEPFNRWACSQVRIAIKFEFYRTLPQIDALQMAAATSEARVLTWPLEFVNVLLTLKEHCVLNVRCSKYSSPWSLWGDWEISDPIEGKSHSEACDLRCLWPKLLYVWRANCSGLHGVLQK